MKRLLFVLAAAATVLGAAVVSAARALCDGWDTTRFGFHGGAS